MTPPKPTEHGEQAERLRVLTELEDWLEKPMIILGAIWFCLVLVELIWTTSGIFEFIGTVIWVVFIAEFALRFTLAPNKLLLLRKNVINPSYG